MSEEEVALATKIETLVEVARFRPAYSAAIVVGSVVTAVLEGVGLSFILPIVEFVNESGPASQQAEGVMLIFVRAYELLGVPFTLGSVIVGVSFVLTIRWTLTFAVRWLREVLRVKYGRNLQVTAFNRALESKIAYFDREGSDDILNTIVTQADFGSEVISQAIAFVEQALISLIYFTIALVIAPWLTILTVVVLGGLSGLFRFVIEPGYEIGDKVADANEEVQRTAQAGMQGIRDTKLFGMQDELSTGFVEAANEFVDTTIQLRKNEQGINTFYNLLTAISVFVLIFLAITYVEMSLGALGIFLFAIFRLAPKVSSLNSLFYGIENRLPHLVRTREFIDELDRYSESQSGSEPVPAEVGRLSFEDVWFKYGPEQDEHALRGITFEFEKGEFVGFVGQSGAGKSTIVSLIARIYEPTEGHIRANGTDIGQMNIDDWRDRVAVVQQDPFIFNETLRYNITVGNRDADDSEIDRIARFARIDEFLDDLPDGYNTELGEDGVRLSGGQRQRVALARALLKENADFLVLDEATSDLDSNLERQVQKAIEEMEQDYAIIAIAHRLSTVQNADRIYTVEEGEITETGDHEELLASSGKYAELYTIQSQQ